MTVPYLLRFCPYRASILWQPVTQGVASLALGYALVGLSARPRLNQKLLFVIVFKVQSYIFIVNNLRFLAKGVRCKGISSQLPHILFNKFCKIGKIKTYSLDKQVFNAYLCPHKTHKFHLTNKPFEKHEAQSTLFSYVTVVVAMRNMGSNVCEPHPSS